MNLDLAQIKLAAFLHDPPHKPLVLGRGAGHEAYAARVRQALGLGALLTADRKARAQQADHLAAAADRPNFPAGVAVSFEQAPALSHPLASPTDTQPSVFQLRGLPTALDPEAVTRGVERAAAALRACNDPLPRLYLRLWRYLPDYLRGGERDAQADVPAAQQLGLLWDALPADTRVPDHTIWDHLAVTAALAGALPRPAFLVFALGPVQGFIAQARTTRDLWAGSFLLSHLAWAAMQPLCDALGPDCILYPALRGQPPVDRWLQQAHGIEAPSAQARAPHHSPLASLPNKFVALVPYDQANTLAGHAAEAVQAEWQQIATDVCGWLTEQGLAVNPQTWHRQITAQVETVWIALPWPEPARVAGEAAARAWLTDQLQPWLTKAGLQGFWTTFDAYARHGRYAVNAGTLYAPLHGLAQRLFDAAKLARRFGAAPEPGYKCTLCGEREPVLAGEASYADQRAAWAQAAKVLADALRRDGRERLCAVCLTKRLASGHSRLRDATGGAPAFPSTSAMAALPVKRWLIAHAKKLSQLDDFLAAMDLLFEESQRSTALDAAIRVPRTAVPALVAATETLSGPARHRAERLLEIDGEWLFAETYTRYLQTVPQADTLHTALEEARTALAEVWRQAEALSPKPPPRSPYYAILLMDGDHLGRWVRGAQHTNRLRDLLHPAAAQQLAADPGWQEALDARRLFGPSTHAALSSALLAFARYTVPWFVEHQGQGRVVYAGGDDLLALLPLPQALATADTLRRAYAQPYVLVARRSGEVRLTPPASFDPRQDWSIERHLGPQATMSAGLALVHHLYPLGAALEQVRRWEREAKECHGRAAFVVGVIRRSGPDLTFGGKWELLDPLLTAQRAFASGALPDRLPYAVRELAERAGALDDAAARRALLTALLRERGESRAGAPADAAWLYGAAEQLRDADERPYDLGRIADLLMMARFLAQEGGEDGSTPDA
ncbi:MAG TPA: type III-B CRISPR-associated protein Cas10/Cmr2 [Chloroflexota bacterium]|nr:type III-B CRISPR-associated protein Cas10/Cmr2 [Chloroflexota bacterium]